MIGASNLYAFTAKTCCAMAALIALLCCAVPGFPAAAQTPPAAPAPATAPSIGPDTGLPVPRFVSLKFNKVYMRQGPGTDHRVLWVYRNNKGLPVEITAEVEHWRRIRDKDGDEGWVHRSQLRGNRSAVVIAATPQVLRRQADLSGRPVAVVASGMVGRLRACKKSWCRMTFDGHTGWMPRTVIWGVYPNEKIGQ